jgi:hypothetical protein
VGKMGRGVDGFCILEFHKNVRDVCDFCFPFFEKIQALPDILREIFSKSDHF